MTGKGHMKKEVRQVDARQMIQRWPHVNNRYTHNPKVEGLLEKEADCIKTIPALPQTKSKLRVCAYCRVSTLRETQASSIDSQSNHYEEHIKSNPEWVYAGIYIEEGVTGTKTEVRPELQRLLNDCRAHKIDLILTKSISRFARNTKDCLELVRYLTSLGISIWFEKENIHTDSMNSDFLLSIFACLAEEESHSISGNVKWSIRKKFEDGSYKQALAPFGYEWKNKMLVVSERESEIVKQIFRMALSGLGYYVIANFFNNKKIPGPTGKEWSPNEVSLILSNLVYTGDILFQKTFVDESFRQKKNQGEMDQYLVDDHHEAIISKDDFKSVQVLMKVKSKIYANDKDLLRNAEKASYCFTSILICSDCGSAMYRVKNKDSVCWVCKKHLHNAANCPMKPQADTDLRSAFINCLNKLSWSGIPEKYETLLKEREAEHHAERLELIEKLLKTNQREKKKLTATIMREKFRPKHRERNTFLEKEAKELLLEKNRILIGNDALESLQTLKDFVRGWTVTDDVQHFPEDKFQTLVKKCIVCTGESVIFEMNCGLKLRESLRATT